MNACIITISPFCILEDFTSRAKYPDGLTVLHLHLHYVCLLSVCTDMNCLFSALAIQIDNSKLHITKRKTKKE